MTRRQTLVLSGGNALGAYQGGACEELFRRDIRPDRIVGSSIGAITGALIAGNPVDQGISQLRRFWSEAIQDSPLRPVFSGKRARAFPSLMFGSPNGFRPRYPGGLSLLPGMFTDTSLYDLSPLRATLMRMVDFERLNHGDVRLTVVATDATTGEEVHFDSGDAPITPDHLLASCGLFPFFPPVEIEGRLLGDGGLSANLPLRAALSDPAPADHLCIAIDLFSPKGERPHTVGQAIDRQFDLLFAGQTRQTLEALRETHALRQEQPGTLPQSAANKQQPKAATTVLLLRPGPIRNDAGLRAFDYSGSVLAARWEAGHRGMEQLLRILDDQKPAPGAFVVHEVAGDQGPDESPPP